MDLNRTDKNVLNDRDEKKKAVENIGLSAAKMELQNRPVGVGLIETTGIAVTHRY